MKIKRALGLLACATALLLAAGCGQNEGPAGKRASNNQNNVQRILEQGISDAGSTDETDSDIPEQDAPAADAAEEPQSITQEETPSPVPTSESVAEIPSQVPASEAVADPSTASAKDDVDLTALSSTMVYSEVYNMMTHPEDYIGKTVKMSGAYSIYHDESTDKYYHACIISDATACCSQGIEFELTEDYTYPDDYPEEGGQICVSGTFDTYREGEYKYCTLRDAKILG
ncbi:MAG: hypothetical protein K5696_10230 [Lachnospiraceae bacterium]|nr:hypothetical protein [Lachnospiraceae bacterium]